MELEIVRVLSCVSWLKSLPALDIVLPTAHALRVRMKSGFSKIFPALCLVVFLAVRSFAADTNSISSLTDADAVANGYLQIQMQLHDAQMALEKSREEARQTAADTTARIQALEQTIAARHAADLEVAQKNQQSMFMLAGAFGQIGRAHV